MAFLKNIVNQMYSAYCVILFFMVMLLLMVVYAAVLFMNDRFRTLTAYHANKILGSLWLKACGFSISIEGAEKIDPSKTYMFICNHTNMLDLPVTGYFLQHYYKSLAKKELKYVPIFGFLLRVSSILVDRSSAESRRNSTQIIVNKLKSGVSFLIFPEGTRNKTNMPLKKFYGGAFKTAIMAGVPILPFVYLDHHYLQPVGTFHFHPGRIRIKVLDAIETKDLNQNQSKELQDQAYQLMENVVKNEDKDFKGNNTISPKSLDRLK